MACWKGKRTTIKALSGEAQAAGCDVDGKVVLWQKGYDLNIEAKVKAALARLSK